VPENCRTETPALRALAQDHYAACWYPLERADELQEAARG
jgi:hypothetical protein